MSGPETIAVLGGGIVGVSIAYFLAKRGRKVILIERKEIACAAGGKGGGFLARSWGDGGPTQALHHGGCDLHKALASELGISSYRAIPTLSVAVSGSKPAQSTCPWLDCNGVKAEGMDENTAQVAPKEYCDKVAAAAVKLGTQIVYGKVDGLKVSRDANGNQHVSAVIVEERNVMCDAVIVAMGPWSVLVEEWLAGQAIPMEGIKSTSLVFKRENVAPFALFCGEDRNGCHLEVYPRSSGEVYICGCGGSQYIQSDELKKIGPDDIDADPKRVQAATKSFSQMSSLAEGGPDITQACMRPCPPDAKPYMGHLPDTSNAYIAAGHNCWGITWAPITGKVMAELVIDGKASIDLSAFDPARFARRKSQQQKKRGRQNASQGYAVGEQW
eukprot:gnl/MRDRNA2_/MRDRNA2_129321_c0_seq1.p1 gnl/MRDRNA2_/MRDRNA2_129321_c0~~gnl/MRDRNA2_/MRDRNA2_129321_c0_seq1.p1  ORF type:complete len:386 (-),score=68.33 gnl/MRDRNA2_/MRDRNA2_129321_c0_seq1:27-1184(-)